MKYELLQALGTDDASHCNKAFAANLSTKACDLAAGCVVDLSQQAVDYLTGIKGYAALLGEPQGNVKGVAKPAEVKGVKE